MKFFSRSSRATGPKMRVPAGIEILVDDDDGVVVETQIAAVVAPDRLLRADDHGADHLAFLHGAAADASRMCAVMTSPTRASGVRFADDTDHLGHARAGIVRDIESGSNLKHKKGARDYTLMFDDFNQTPPLQLGKAGGSP